MRGGLAVVVALLGGLGVAGCGGGSAPETVTRTATATEPASAAPLATKPCAGTPGFRCASLTVPVHRRGPRAGDGRTLRLAFAVQHGRPAPRGDLLLLTGGPGQPGLPFGPRMAGRLRGALRGYRLVVVDQRGTGSGALRCPALQRSVGSSDLAVPPPSAVTACARSLGPDRDAFATADTVADLDALRTALGDRRWTIAGISYGTLVAQRYALAHPARTRALVLDSVVPQEGAELLERVPIAATARVLHAVCARAAHRCAGDPARDLAAVVARSPALGPPLLDALTELSIGVPRLGPIPELLHRARAGDLGPLRALLRHVRTEERSPPVAQFSSGLHAATLCADSPTPWTGGPTASAAARTAALRDAQTTPTALGQGLLQTCLRWPPTSAPPPPPRGPIRTPTLLLAGDEDLSTPLEWARLQASRMPHARLVIVPGAGHSTLSRSHDPHALTALRTFLHP